MELSNKEKKRRQYNKELKSLRNKMGINLIWFDSLSKDKQYNILFGWKRQKYYKRNITKPETIKVKSYRKYRFIKTYPANVKHYIKVVKNYRKYRSTVSNLRQAAIDIILNKK